MSTNEVAGPDSSVPGKRSKLLFGGWRGDEANGTEAKKRGKERGKNGVAGGDGLGQVGVDELRAPEDGDKGAGEDARDRSGRSGPPPEEGREDHRSERGGIDRVGVERLFQHRVGAEGLEQRPTAEEDDYSAADEKDVAVRSFGFHVADVDVVDEIGSRREEIVIGGGDDFCEDNAHHDGPNQIAKS